MSSELLATARWLHQRDANATTVVWATALVLAMATLLAAILGAVAGSLIHHTFGGLILGAALPLAHAVKTLAGRQLRHRQAQRTLKLTDPQLIATVHEWNQELVQKGTRYEIRTPRKIQLLQVLHKEDLTLIHLDYPEWYQQDDPQVKGLVKKARPC